MTRHKERLTQRKVVFRPIDDGDMRWLWAAYQMGTWNDVLTEGLSRDEFSTTVVDLLGAVHHDWMVEVPAGKGLRPIGVITAMDRFAGHGIEPHVDWFPWASTRNKLEVSVQFLLKIGHDVKIHLYIREEDQKFWHRVWQYKVIKNGCKISGCYGVGHDAIYYNTPGPF
ncbi:MAG: hypothetical protein V3U60_11025 [Gammaproteobacteria bacterium]